MGNPNSIRARRRRRGRARAALRPQHAATRPSFARHIKPLLLTPAPAAPPKREPVVVVTVTKVEQKPNPMVQAMRRVQELIARGTNYRALAGKVDKAAGLNLQQRREAGLSPVRRRGRGTPRSV